MSKNRFNPFTTEILPAKVKAWLAKAFPKSDKKPHEHPAETPAQKKSKLIYVITGSSVAAILFAGALTWFYWGHVMPNVTVGSVKVEHATESEVKSIVQKQSNMYMTIIGKGVKRVAPIKDIGLTVDVDATVRNVMMARRNGDWLQNIQLWKSKDIPLSFNNNPGALMVYIQKFYPSIYVAATDAHLEYNSDSKQFDIVPGTNGKGFDVAKFESSISDLALHPQNVTLVVTSSPVKPIIQEKALTEPQKQVNQTVGLLVRFLLNGNVIYQASQDQIASWAYFTSDPVKGTISVKYDKAKIQQFINDSVAPTVTVAPINRKVFKDATTGVETVLTQGRNGQQIQDSETVTNSVYDAVSAGKGIDQPISIVQAPFITNTIVGNSGGGGGAKMIEVNLSQQRLTMYEGNTVIRSVLVSTGKAATPTQVGEFAIYAKYPMQTMTGTINGEYYYVPNIKWVSYFDGGEALHGTYWHHNFGHPMSHGCVNMTEDDAYFLYNWAPIGTKVVVHY